MANAGERTERFGRADVFLFGEARFVQSERSGQTVSLPADVDATVVSAFAVEACRTAEPFGVVRVNVLLKGNPILLVALVRDSERTFCLRAPTQGKPGTARFSFEAQHRGTHVHVIEFRKARDVEVFLDWFNGDSHDTPEPDVWEELSDDQFSDGGRVRERGISHPDHLPHPPARWRRATQRAIDGAPRWSYDAARQFPERMIGPVLRSPSAPLPEPPPVEDGAATATAESGFEADTRSTDSSPQQRTSRRRTSGGSTNGGEGQTADSQTAAIRRLPADTHPPLVLAHALAEMPAVSAVGRPVDVIFKLSRDHLAANSGAATDEARFMVEPSALLTVSISARGYRLIHGPRSRAVGLPASGAKPLLRRFKLVGTDVGRGEVMIVVRTRDEIAPIACLRLISEIVLDNSVSGTVRESVDASPPDSALTNHPSISIDESICGHSSELTITLRIGDEVVRCTTRIGDKARFIRNTFGRIAGLRKRLANEGGGADERRRMALEELRSLGMGLSQALFNPAVRRLLWERFDDFTFPVIQTTGEFDIPWELVYVSDPGIPLNRQEVDVERFLGMRGVTRWVYNTALPTDIVVGRERARYLCPAYVDRGLALTHTREEGILVKRTFGARVVRPGDATAMSRVITSGFDLLHFAGHGVWLASDPPDQRLLLTRYKRKGEAPAGSSYSASDLRRDLPDRKMDYRDVPGRMVFLNACDVGKLDSTGTGLGGFPEAFLRGGIGVLIGCSWTIDDNTAGAFARDFYAALNEMDVAHAADAARRKALMEDDLSWLAYVIYGHPNATIRPSRRSRRIEQ